MNGVESGVGCVEIAYSAACKVCNSEHRAEAERRYRGGETYTGIAHWLASVGVSVSIESVRRHMHKHAGIADEVAKRYAEKAAAEAEKAVQRRLSDIEILDDIIESNHRLQKAAQLWAQDVLQERGKLPQPLVQLLQVTASEARQAMKTKRELLGESPVDALADALQELWSGDGES